MMLIKKKSNGHFVLLTIHVGLDMNVRWIKDYTFYFIFTIASNAGSFMKYVC